MANPDLLQLCPVEPFMTDELARRFTVHRLYEQPDPAAWLAAHAADIRAVLTGGHLGIETAMLAALPGAGIVAINGVGFDRVDLEAAKRQGVRVTNTPDVLTDDVADLAIGLLIGLLRRIPQGDAHVRAGQWPKGQRPLAHKMSGRRYGILGLGRIGRAVADRLAGFPGEVAYTDRASLDVPHVFHPDAVALATACDVLIVTASASEATRGLVDRAVLDALGPTGVLVNVARGSIVDEPALIEALQTGRLAGAALDVFADEPNVPEALRVLDNVLLTPHIASATVETREAMGRLVLANLDAFFAGREPPTALV
jgi:lactate dehydrogenase-like 2-hydroxyacid dehydrogenase